MDDEGDDDSDDPTKNKPKITDEITALAEEKEKDSSGVIPPKFCLTYNTETEFIAYGELPDPETVKSSRRKVEFTC